MKATNGTIASLGLLGKPKSEVNKYASAPELPPIRRTTTTGSAVSRTGSALSKTGSDAITSSFSVGRKGDRVESAERQGRQRSSSFPAVPGDRLNAQAKAKASYKKSVQKRRVSLIAEDPHNELAPAVPPCSPEATPISPAWEAADDRQRLFMSRSMSSMPQASPFHDPDWQDYLNKAKQSKLKKISSINTYSLYNLDPTNLARTLKKRVETPPKAKTSQTPVIGVMSEDRLKSMVHPVDTDFRIMQWIKDCEQAEEKEAVGVDLLKKSKS